MTDDVTKHPRLYVDGKLSAETAIPLNEMQAHYVLSVMRRKNGDFLRVFNGIDGEWLCRIETPKKKSCDIVPQTILRVQPTHKARVHFLFAPITKTRNEWMIEKAVELGATDFHPVLTQNTEVRKINEERVRAQIIEATEQCERLILPVLHPIQSMMAAVADMGMPVLACIERYDAKHLRDALPDGDCAFLIGPVGGFTEEEKSKLASSKAVIPVSLGDSVLRCETAAVMCLSLIQGLRK